MRSATAAICLGLVAVLSLASLASATVFYKEQFGSGWEDRWIKSSWKGSEAGSLKVSAGEWYGDAEKDRGLQTTQDARFYAYSSKFPKAFSNAGKDLVIQFQIKHPQKIDCGGGYVKVLPEGFDQAAFGGESPYYIMFGPDVCGTSTKKVHVIFGFQGKNLLTKKEIRCETDQLSHVYTLIVRPDNTYEVRVDGTKKESGSLYDDWEFTLPRKIKDPAAKKPTDWVDKPKMDDPSDVKPADYDSQPKEIPDPNASKPSDWDDEADGEWEVPTIPNPEFKGEWKARQIDNPAYKGPWVHPEIDNPDYKEEKDVYKYDNFGGIGIDIWQVKSGTIFSNIFVSDSVSEAEQFLADTWSSTKNAEKAMFDAAEDKKKKEEAAEREKIEALKAKENEDDDEDDDDEDDDSGKKKNHDDEL